MYSQVDCEKKTHYTQKNQKIHTILWEAFIRGEGIDYQDNHDGTIPAFMFRTGGTTGIPKEVVACGEGFNAIAEEVHCARMCNCWERQKTSLLLLPPFIAFGVSSGIHVSVTGGLKTVISLDVSPAAVSSLFKKYQPNYSIGGTVQIEQWMKDLKKQKIDLSYLQILSLGGEAMSRSFEEELCTFLKKHHCNAIPLKGYGLTETAGGVTTETIDAHKIGSVGIPLALCNMKIVDTDSGEELTYNTPGEICLSSPGVMKGYFQNQQATDDIIEVIDGVKWLHTGDIGFISEDGLLTITGRIKRIIVCKEGIIYHKVFPLLIEDQLARIPGVQEISIVGRPDEGTSNVLVAYVVPETKDTFEQVVNLLKAYCDDHLQSYARPVDYVYMKELPHTMIGKVDYRTLELMVSSAL